MHTRSKATIHFDEREAEVVFTTGGLSEAKPGIIPDAGLLEFNTEGGAPYLQKGRVI